MGNVKDVVSLQPEAFETLITTFYETGKVDDTQFVYAPMDFGVKWGFPVLTKEALGVILALFLVILGGTWFIIRRSHKNNPLDHPSGV